LKRAAAIAVRPSCYSVGNNWLLTWKQGW